MLPYKHFLGVIQVQKILTKHKDNPEIKALNKGKCGHENTIFLPGKKILGFILRERQNFRHIRNDDMDKESGTLVHYLEIKCLYL